MTHNHLVPGSSPGGTTLKTPLFEGFFVLKNKKLNNQGNGYKKTMAHPFTEAYIIFVTPPLSKGLSNLSYFVEKRYAY